MGSLALDCLAFRPSICGGGGGRESAVTACSCSLRANSAGVTSSGLALPAFFLVADCFAVAVVEVFGRTTEVLERERSSVLLPGVVTMLVSSRRVRVLASLTRFATGDSAITSVNSSMIEVTSWMEAGVLATVEVLAVLSLCPSPATGVGL